jgi:hypothetical protein
MIAHNTNPLDTALIEARARRIRAEWLKGLFGRRR